MRLHVKGQAPLNGTYTPSGSSNEAITLIAASLLPTETVTLDGVPDTASVRLMVEMANELGTSCTWDGGQLTLHTPRIIAQQRDSAHPSRMVAAVLLQAPMLARHGHAMLEWTEPLGRIHTHLAALRDLGVDIDINGQTLTFTARPWGQRDIVLVETSVTSTAMVCMLAAAIDGETVVHNAACEPHLRSLQHMLVKMGAQIDGIGSNLLRIRGASDGLSGVTHAIQPDHVEIASVAAISAILPGEVSISTVLPDDLRMIDKTYERLGIRMHFDDHTLHVPEQGALVISQRQEDIDVEIGTSPWPGFPSDLVAMVTVAATQAEGTTLIHEKLFNNRLLFVDKLKAMGAQIVLADPHRAIVIGSTPLRGEYIDTPDVRIGLALLGAALAAEGESIIDRAQLVERNFENVIHKLIGLGAQITVEDG